MEMVPAREHSKRTEDEWIDAIKTEYVECTKETKLTKPEAMAAFLRLATNVCRTHTLSLSLSLSLGLCSQH
jgi:hypothetical protein